MERLSPILKSDDGNILSSNISSYSSPPYVVFDGDKSENAYRPVKNNCYIGYNFNKKVQLQKYIIYPWYYGSSTGQVNCPTNWILQGSNDNVMWIDIEKRSDLPIDWGGAKEFLLERPAVYKMFRLFNIGAYGNPGIYEIEFWGSFNAPKYLIEQNSDYYYINHNYIKIEQLGDGNQLANWIDKYGYEDISILTKTLNNKKTPVDLEDDNINVSWKIDFNDVIDNINLIEEDNDKYIKYTCSDYKVINEIKKNNDSKFNIIMKEFL